MFKGKNKKGWIRMVEVFFAIFIIATVVLIVIEQDQRRKEEVSSRIQNSVTSIIREIQLNNTLRTEIISISESDLPVESGEEFSISAPQTLEKIIEKTPNYLECAEKICATSDPCLLSQNIREAVYAESVVISSNLQTYNPRILKLFCWEG